LTEKFKKIISIYLCKHIVLDSLCVWRLIEMKMKIKIINPNTLLEMTDRIRESAEQYARPETEIVCVSPEKGPITIEDYYDEAIATVGVMEEVQKGEREEGGYDGYIIACFGDPGLYQCREITEVPVVGIAESSLLLATTLGTKFSILGILDRFKVPYEELVHKVGLQSRCAAVVCNDVTVQDFEKDRGKAKNALLEAGKKAIKEYGAEVMCLGCAGMAGLDIELEKALGVPVLDPIGAAVKVCEGLIELGKKTSKINTFKPPEKKEIKGYPKILQP